MKSIFIVSLFFMVFNVKAEVSTCRLEIGFVQADKINKVCEEKKAQGCSINLSCTELILKTCSANTNDQMKIFACVTNIISEYVDGFDAHEICEEYSAGDANIYFSCRVNLYSR